MQIYACNETNSMHYLSLVSSVTIPLHVSGLLVAHRQEVKIYIYVYSLYIYIDYIYMTIGKCCHIYIYIYRLLPPDDGLLASPKHVDVQWLNKLKINSASSWFRYTQTKFCDKFKRVTRVLCSCYAVCHHPSKEVLMSGRQAPLPSTDRRTFRQYIVKQVKDWKKVTYFSVKIRKRWSSP
jgi:hypothetical protein